MKKYLTRKNLGWALTAGLSVILTMSAMSKLFGSDEGLIREMGVAHIIGWMKIIGAGELISLILFIIPKTMRLGALLLSAYFGGAIMFHMAHPDVARQAFMAPAGFLLFIWAITWIRGTELIGDYNPTA